MVATLRPSMAIWAKSLIVIAGTCRSHVSWLTGASSFIALLFGVDDRGECAQGIGGASHPRAYRKRHSRSPARAQANCPAQVVRSYFEAGYYSSGKLSTMRLIDGNWVWSQIITLWAPPLRVGAGSGSCPVNFARCCRQRRMIAAASGSPPLAGGR